MTAARFSPDWYDEQPVSGVPWFGRVFDAVFDAAEWITRPIDRFARHDDHG